MRAFPWPPDYIGIMTALSRRNTSSTSNSTRTSSTPPILHLSEAVVVVHVVGVVGGRVTDVGVRPVIPLPGNPPSPTQMSQVRLGTLHLRSQPSCPF
jgi:hypothetical protein